MDGILLIDKPSGMTSHDVVNRVRRILHERRVGHAGTLDPFAIGLLIIGVGKATKKLSTFAGSDKEYEAELILGATSDTFDREGKISVIPANDRTRNDIDGVLDRFRGGYEQRAPIFSAKKIKGRKLYELARRGRATEEMRPIKHVSINELRVMRYAWPVLTLKIECSSGTYIRSLADDIGRALGCGAYVNALRRTKIGDLRVEQAIRLENLTIHALDTPASE